jgi:hypothetical protein
MDQLPTPKCGESCDKTLDYFFFAGRLVPFRSDSSANQQLIKRTCGQSGEVSNFAPLSDCGESERSKRLSKAPGLYNSTFNKTFIKRHMRFRDASLMFKPRDPCPVFGAETTLAEIEPHPKHVILRFMDTSVIGAGPSNPWLWVARRPLQSVMYYSGNISAH